MLHQVEMRRNIPAKADNLLIRSFSHFLASVLRPITKKSDYKHFCCCEYLSITIMRRYAFAYIPPVPLNLLPTDIFIQQANAISNQKIAVKLKKFILLATKGDQLLNDSNLNKADRFAPESINYYFDSDGRYHSDFLLDSLGIQHFHIGYDKKTDDNLIFTIRQGTNLYLLAIGTHRDMYIENEQSVLHQALREFGPQYYDNSILKMEMDLGKRPHDAITLDHIKKMKAAGLTTLFTASDGTVRMSDLGISTARVPTRVVLDVNRIIRELVFYLYGENLSVIDGDRFRILSIENSALGPLLICRDYVDKDNKKYLFTLINKESKLMRLIELIEEVHFVSDRPNRNVYELISKIIKSPENQKAMRQPNIYQVTA